MSADLVPFAADVNWFRTGNGNFATDTHIRVIRDENGEPLFIAADIARALGYRMASDMTRRIDPEDRGTRSVRTPSGEQDMTVLTESGFYAAVLGSQVPHAKEFKRWVTAEVLPSIRRTGGYSKAVEQVQPLTPLEYARRLVDAEERAEAEHARADKAEKRAEIESRHRRAIEAGDGIKLTDFGKKYFSEVRHTDFFEHLYKKNWLIDQRKTRVRPDGEVRDGHDHGKPTYKGRPFIYEHDNGNHGGQRRFQSRVRPQKEIELRDALAAEGLPVNTHSTGLVLITNDDLKELGA